MSNEKLEEFRNGFLQKVKNKQESVGGFPQQIFLEEFINQLIELEIFDDMPTLFHWSATGVQVSGYAFEKTKGEDSHVNVVEEIDLFVEDFSESTEMPTITQTDVNVIVKRVSNFVRKSIEEKYFEHVSMDESHPAYQASYSIWNYRKSLFKVNVYVISDRVKSSRIKFLKADPVKLDDNKIIDINIHLWDISRLFAVIESGSQRTDMEIIFSDYQNDPIFCLPAHSTNTHISYLFVIPGTVLAAIYDEYGSRLLEQNVRTFLQVRGTINKGIRDTLLNEPEKFFTYNNGLSAVADSIETQKGEWADEIVKITNFQIVNGGQTTASIYNVMKNYREKADLSKVFVQVKLTIVTGTDGMGIIPLISKYSNTQNSVKASDFASNHPYHIKLEKLSRSIYTDFGSKWFYERARGQYIDQQANKTDAGKKTFLIDYPKNQYFVMVDVAKYMSVWEEIPYIVSKGRQHCFEDFNKKIDQAWQKKELTEDYINPLYFKQLIAKIIVFKKTDQIISNSIWYLNSRAYKSQTVAYTLSLLAHTIAKYNAVLNFVKIWKVQALSPELESFIESLAEKVFQYLLQPPPNVSNVGEWAKKEECWITLTKTLLKVDVTSIRTDLVKIQAIKDIEEAQAIQEQEKREAEWMVLFSQLSETQIVRIKEIAVNNNILIEPIEMSILEQSGMKNGKLLSDKQCKILIKLIRKIENCGVDVNKILGV